MDLWDLLTDFKGSHEGFFFLRFLRTHYSLLPRSEVGCPVLGKVLLASLAEQQINKQ